MADIPYDTTTKLLVRSFVAPDLCFMDAGYLQLRKDRPIYMPERHPNQNPHGRSREKQS